MNSSGRLWTRGFSFFIGTQFFGAFNDNAFKFLVIGYAASCLSPEAYKDFLPLASAMFIVPFLLFSSYAGYLADRFAKRTVMIWTKVLEVAVMLAGWWLFREQHVYGLVAVLFCMGAQSTFFSPGKYGYLPETLPDTWLSAGNGMVQLFTFLAIIAGGGIGSALAEKYTGCVHLGGVWCVVVAVIGLATSFGIGRTRPGNRDVHPSFDPVMPHIRTFRTVLTDRILLFAVIGSTYFWLLATVYQTNIAIIVKQDMQLGDTNMGYLQAALALGIGLGSALAGALSRGKIAYQFVLPGGLLVAFLTVAGGFASTSLIASLLLAAALGIAAGFYQIPLTTCIQQRSPANRRGACIAACNALDCISMLLGTALHWLLLKPLQLSGGGVLIVLGLLTLVFMLFLPRLLKKRPAVPQP